MKTGAEWSPFVFAMDKIDTHNSDVNSSLLFQLDPRLKLLLVIIAIAFVFVTVSWYRLLLLSAVACSLLLILDGISVYRQRLFWLRWFFAFVVVLHLLLSPGHTLFGFSWLSYDGLLRGLYVSLQVMTALAFSLALSRATSSEKMTAAAASILSPLNLLGLNVNGFVSQILMALNFVPILREEGAEAVRKVAETYPADEFTGLSGRVRKLQLLVLPLLSGLVARADVMAHESARKNNPCHIAPALISFWPLSRGEFFTICSTTFVSLVYWGLP